MSGTAGPTRCAAAPNLRRGAFAFGARVAFLAGVVDVGGSKIGIRGFFFVHGMIRLLARGWGTAGLVGAVFVGHFMRVDLARRLAVFDGLLGAIGLICGSGLVVVEAAHAAFGFWLGSFVAATGIGSGIGHGDLHGNDRSNDNSTVPLN